MGNMNLKGRATAKFAIEHSIVDGVLRVIVTSDATTSDYSERLSIANGTVALGKELAELGKSATPITAADRKFATAVANNMAAGLELEQATALATVNAAV